MALRAGLLPLGRVARSRRARRGTSAASTTPHTTSLIEATLRSPTQLAAYDVDVADQLPVVWQPTPVTLLETRAAIHDVVALAARGDHPRGVASLISRA